MKRTKQSVQRELRQQYGNLSAIEEKIALYTELEAPIYLLNQRNQTNERIEELEVLLSSGELPDESVLDEAKVSSVNNAPPLPPHYVHREEQIVALRNLLLGEERQTTAALRGMGGMGKTTLAIALCHDQAVLDAFTDGILWATLGPDADVLSAQAIWGTLLGEDLTNLPSAEARASHLRALLRDKRCLLIVDDVWDTTDLELMRVGGPQCGTLVTTRERKVVQKVGVSQDLKALEPEQAIILLEQWES